METAEQIFRLRNGGLWYDRYGRNSEKMLKVLLYCNRQKLQLKLQLKFNNAKFHNCNVVTNTGFGTLISLRLKDAVMSEVSFPAYH